MNVHAHAQSCKTLTPQRSASISRASLLCLRSAPINPATQRDYSVTMSAATEGVRVRAREGEEVEWSTKAARRAGTLKDMMDDAPTENGIYPENGRLPIAAAELTMLGAMCEADDPTPASLAQRSVPELLRLVDDANYLDAPRAVLQQVQQAVAARLVDKCADELRTLLGATDDLSAEERAAALAEPAFIPEGDEPTPPALQPQPSLLSVTDDAKELALATVDVGTLTELKGVSRAWRTLARRVLCSRLCSVDGQPVPKEKAEITNVNIELLFEAGRPWEAAAAGRQLPSLARLRWQGLVVDVAAVREVDLDEEDEEDEEDEDEEDEDEFGRPFLGGPAKESLLGCIEGEGEPPLELLLAAVACAGSGAVRGIPVEEMRNDSVAELDMHSMQIGTEGSMLIAYLVPVMASLTSCDVRGNAISGEGASQLSAAVLANTKIEKFNEISIKEMRADSLTTLKLPGKDIGVVGGLVVGDLMPFMGSLTKVRAAACSLLVCFW